MPTSAMLLKHAVQHKSSDYVRGLQILPSASCSAQKDNNIKQVYQCKHSHFKLQMSFSKPDHSNTRASVCAAKPR